MRPPFAPCLFMALALAACNASETAMTQQTSPASPHGAVPNTKYNPHPKRAYQITVSIDNAPGTFAYVAGLAQYDVNNDAQCGDLNEMTGTRMHITNVEPFSLTKISATEYQGTMYADLMQDEDYYNAGVCHWELTVVHAVLKATGRTEETTFRSTVEAATVFSQGTVTKYLWKEGYPREEGLDNYLDDAEDSVEAFKTEIREQLFSITLTPKRIAP